MTQRWIALAALAATTALVPAVQAQTNADTGSWLVRGRALYLDPVGQNTALDLSINSKLFPEVDITYFFTPNIATELVLTVPQKQTVTVQQSALGGPVAIGTFKHLPPTLLLQYKFNPHGKIQPYVGAGANYTLIWGDDLAVGNLALRLDNHSTVAAAQAGVDVKIDGHWSINLDAKWVQIRSDVTAAGVKITQARLDPMLYAAGVRYAF